MSATFNHTIIAATDREESARFYAEDNGELHIRSDFLVADDDEPHTVRVAFILNLVNNACYAVNEKLKMAITGYDPVITISTKRLGSQVEIRVKDNGIGIPEDIVSKLFLPFFTTKPHGKGTGLGLSLTYNTIAETHKGTIEVHSTPGEQTEFIIVIPA